MAQPYTDPLTSTGPVQPALISQARPSAGNKSTTTGTNSQAFLESVLPGVSSLTTSATGVIGNLLNGLPSAPLARTTNAYWGVGAGTPASGTGGAGDINSFIGQRGTDLYNTQANSNQQTGLNDLLQTIGTYTSPALANQGQQLQNTQFNNQLSQQGDQFSQSQGQQLLEFLQSQGQQQGQFNTTNQNTQFENMLSALGLGNSITGQLPGNINLTLP